MSSARQVVAAVLAGGVLAVAGCGGDARNPEELLAPSDTCGELERPTVQDGGHLIGDQAPPVPYNSSPASSGWHSAGAPPTGVHDEPLPDPAIVSVLHLGGVVAAYDPAAVGPGEVALLEDLAGSVEALTVTPYDGELPTPVSLVAWGAIQRCDEVDETAVTAFVDAFAGSADAH